AVGEGDEESFETGGGGRAGVLRRSGGRWAHGGRYGARYRALRAARSAAAPRGTARALRAYPSCGVSFAAGRCRGIHGGVVAAIPRDTGIGERWRPVLVEVEIESAEKHAMITERSFEAAPRFLSSAPHRWPPQLSPRLP